MSRNRREESPPAAHSQEKEHLMPDRTIYTPPGYLSYPHLETPDQYGGKGPAKYRASIIVCAEGDKTAKQLVGEKIVPALRAAAQDKFGKPSLKGLDIAADKVGEKDGETFGDPNAVVIRAANKLQPGFFDEYGHRLDPSDARTFSEKFYPGALCRMKVWSYGWTFGPKRGVSFLVEGIQFIGEGERIGSSSSEVTMDAVRAEPERAAGYEPGEEEYLSEDEDEDEDDSDGMPF